MQPEVFDSRRRLWAFLQLGKFIYAAEFIFPKESPSFSIMLRRLWFEIRLSEVFVQGDARFPQKEF